MASESSPVASSRLPQLPSTVINGSDLAINDRKNVIKVYNAAIARFSATDLPRVKFTVMPSKTNRTGLSKHKQSYKSYSKSWRKSINRPIFTEGISSHSKKQEPLLYMKTNAAVVSSNLPHGVHYSRDKSKIVLETKPKRDKKSSSLATTPSPGSRLSFVDKSPRSISRNYTMLLPKVHIEKEISIIDYVRSRHHPKDNLHFVPIRDNPQFTHKVPIVEEDQIQPITASLNQPNNTPTDSRDIDKLNEAPVLKRESSNLSNTSGKTRGELNSRKGPRISASDIHKVSVGDDLSLSFTRHYGRQSGPPSVDFEFERQKSFESRAALSTPGKNRYRNNRQTDAKSFDSKSIPSLKIQNTKTIAWENGVAQFDGQSEEADVMGAPYDSSRSAKGVIKKYTIGDPFKDCNKQDKKLDKSNLLDLYSRGVVRDHIANAKPHTSRVTVSMLKRDDRFGKFGGSRASGLSTIPGNPPPSLATYLASPAYDANGKSHHPLLSPEMTYLSQALVVEGSNVNSPDMKPTHAKGKLTIDGALLNNIESDRERDMAETFIDKYETKL